MKLMIQWWQMWGMWIICLTKLKAIKCKDLLGHIQRIIFILSLQLSVMQLPFKNPEIDNNYFSFELHNVNVGACQKCVFVCTGCVCVESLSVQNIKHQFSLRSDCFHLSIRFTFWLLLSVTICGWVRPPLWEKNKVTYSSHVKIY